MVLVFSSNPNNDACFCSSVPMAVSHEVYCYFRYSSVHNVVLVAGPWERKSAKLNCHRVNPKFCDSEDEMRDTSAVWSYCLWRR